MEIYFSDVQVRDLCCSRKALVSKFGVKLARLICCRLSVLSAALSLDDIPISPPIGLAPLDCKGRFSMNLGAEHRLLLQTVPNQAENVNGLTKITKVLIIGTEKVPLAKGPKQ